MIVYNLPHIKTGATVKPSESKADKMPELELLTMILWLRSNLFIILLQRELNSQIFQVNRAAHSSVTAQHGTRSLN
jgi:hypothetical protein